jgi:hypothetical protein
MDSLIRLVASAVFFLAISRQAYAYLDPVTGSLLIQGAVAAIAGIVAGVKTIRVKIIQLFSGMFKGRSG